MPGVRSGCAIPPARAVPEARTHRDAGPIAPRTGHRRERWRAAHRRVAGWRSASPRRTGRSRPSGPPFDGAADGRLLLARTFAAARDLHHGVEQLAPRSGLRLAPCIIEAAAVLQL